MSLLSLIQIIDKWSQHEFQRQLVFRFNYKQISAEVTMKSLGPVSCSLSFCDMVCFTGRFVVITAPSKTSLWPWLQLRYLRYPAVGLSKPGLSWQSTWRKLAANFCYFDPDGTDEIGRIIRQVIGYYYEIDYSAGQIKYEAEKMPSDNTDSSAVFAPILKHSWIEFAPTFYRFKVES